MPSFVLSVLSLIAGIVLLLWGTLGDGVLLHVLLGCGAIVAAYYLLAVS